MALTSQQAAKLTAEGLNGPVIEPYIKALDSAIETAARRHGKREILVYTELLGANLDYPRPEVIHALCQHYRRQGFTWTDHQDPDPGHPACDPYTTIEW